MAASNSGFRPHVEQLEAREVLNAAQALNPALLQILANYLPGELQGEMAGVQSQENCTEQGQGIAVQLPGQVEHRLEVVANQIFNGLPGDVQNILQNQINNVSNNILNHFDTQVQGNVLNQINVVGNNILNRPNDNPKEINRLTVLNNVTNNVLNSINNEFGGNDIPGPDSLTRNQPLTNNAVEYSGASPLNS
ncbi:MAG: hypothetical protein L0211_05360 [Planctomycetaceae bacterium]|nr:hypothetical protein [Planctomycetaceae bacterium]